MELIITLTILSILGTIGFLSIQEYSGNARDSARVSDINMVMKSLDLSIVTSGSYPFPDEYFTVTYSGGAVWYQGTVGPNIIRSFKSSIPWGGIGQKPVDPLRNSEYVYSILAYGKAYQVKADYEGSLSYHNSYSPEPVRTAYAASGNPTVSLIKGNYGGDVAKTQTGNTIYVLAVPSIVTGTGAAGQILELSANVLSGTLLFHGKSNAFASSFNPNVVVFSGASLPKDDTGSGITNMMILLKSAYATSDLSGIPSLQSIVNASTGSLTLLGSQIVTTGLGGSVNANGGLDGGSMSNSCAANPSFSNLGTLTTGGPISVNQAWTYSATPGNCTYECINGYSGNNCAMAPVAIYSSSNSTSAYTAGQQFTWSGITVTVSSAWIGTWSSAYPGCDTPDIVLWASGYNPQIWAACNVGATTSVGFDTVPTASPSLTLPANRLSNVQGNYYQWWRNDDVTTGTYAWDGVMYTGTLTSPANTTGNNVFYGGDWNRDWKWNGISNPDGGWNTNNGGNNTGPCASGYHVPTAGDSNNEDWNKASNLLFGATYPTTTQYDTMRTVLKLPISGYRNCYNGYYYSQGTQGFYWSSTPSSGPLSNNAYFTPGSGLMPGGSSRWSAYPVRCVRN